jgi:hypothetical protein
MTASRAPGQGRAHRVSGSERGLRGRLRRFVWWVGIRGARAKRRSSSTTVGPWAPVRGGRPARHGQATSAAPERCTRGLRPAPTRARFAPPLQVDLLERVSDTFGDTDPLCRLPLASSRIDLPMVLIPSLRCGTACGARPALEQPENQADLDASGKFVQLAKDPERCGARRLASPAATRSRRALCRSSRTHRAYARFSAGHVNAPRATL